VNRTGVQEVLQLQLDPTEVDMLRNSADVLKASSNSRTLNRTSGVRGPAGAVIGREAAADVLFLMAYAENSPSKQKLTTVA